MTPVEKKGVILNKIKGNDEEDARILTDVKTLGKKLTIVRPVTRV